MRSSLLLLLTTEVQKDVEADIRTTLRNYCKPSVWLKWFPGGGGISKTNTFSFVMTDFRCQLDWIKCLIKWRCAISGCVCDGVSVSWLGWKDPESLWLHTITVAAVLDKTTMAEKKVISCLSWSGDTLSAPWTSGLHVLWLLNFTTNNCSTGSFTTGFLGSDPCCLHPMFSYSHQMACCELPSHVSQFL